MALAVWCTPNSRTYKLSEGQGEMNMTVSFEQTLDILEDHGFGLDTCSYCCKPIVEDGDEEEYTKCICSPKYPASTFRKQVGIEDRYDKKELYIWLGY